jgi:poly-gamma-glutamate synthesis protein (capsule biosynthesis protein)
MPFKIVSVGDYMTGENVHHYRRGIPKKFKNKFRNLIADDVVNLISDGDLLFLNFESSLAEEDKLSALPIEKAVYVAPMETISLLKSLNIPLVANIANNHFGQHGKEVSEYTIQQLENKGITVIGKTNEPVNLVVNGMNLNIWGVSLVKDNSESGSYFKSTYEELCNELSMNEKEENEIRIISIHWGTEYSTIENEKQRQLAKELSLLKFDLILGHHPHTIQPVEKINDTWVTYSHGNFLFDQNFSFLTQKGLVSTFTFPIDAPNLFISQQKNFQVVDFKRVSLQELKKFCLENYSDNSSFLMRIKMKAELLTHFYELNIPIIKTFGGRLINTGTKSN